MEAFSDWLRNELSLRAWSQADLARACNVTNATISRILSGDRKVGTEMALSISRALRVPQEVVFKTVLLFSG